MPDYGRYCLSGIHERTQHPTRLRSLILHTIWHVLRSVLARLTGDHAWLNHGALGLEGLQDRNLDHFGWKTSMSSLDFPSQDGVPNELNTSYSAELARAALPKMFG